MSTRSRMGLAAAALALVGAACGQANSASGEAGVAGSIAIDGSSTVFPIAQAVAEDFQIEHPETKVAIGFSGTGGGFEKFCSGNTAISNASRAIEDDEKQCLEDAGVEYTEFQVGVDGLAVASHPDTGWVDCMTTQQLQAIYEPGSTVTKWSDVDPSWPDEDIAIFGPDPDSGTYDYFAEEVAAPDSDEPSTRDDMTQSADDNVLVQGVGGEAGSIGYFGFAYYSENSDRLKVMSIDGGSGCVEPTPGTVTTGDYPLSRPLFLYVADADIARPEVNAFVTYWIDNAAEYAEAVGYIGAAQDVALANSRKLDALQ